MQVNNKQAPLVKVCPGVQSTHSPHPAVGAVQGGSGRGRGVLVSQFRCTSPKGWRTRWQRSHRAEQGTQQCGACSELPPPPGRQQIVLPPDPKFCHKNPPQGTQQTNFSSLSKNTEFNNNKKCHSGCYPGKKQSLGIKINDFFFPRTTSVPGTSAPFIQGTDHQFDSIMVRTSVLPEAHPS